MAIFFLFLNITYERLTVKIQMLSLCFINWIIFLFSYISKVEWWNPEWNEDLFSNKRIPAVVTHRISIASISMHLTKNVQNTSSSRISRLQVNKTRELPSRSFSSVGKMRQITNNSAMWQEGLCSWRNTGMNCVGSLEEAIIPSLIHSGRKFVGEVAFEWGFERARFECDVRKKMQQLW